MTQCDHLLVLRYATHSLLYHKADTRQADLLVLLHHHLGHKALQLLKLGCLLLGKRLQLSPRLVHLFVCTTSSSEFERHIIMRYGPPPPLTATKRHRCFEPADRVPWCKGWRHHHSLPPHRPCEQFFQRAPRYPASWPWPWTKPVQGCVRVCAYTFACAQNPCIVLRRPSAAICT